MSNIRELREWPYLCIVFKRLKIFHKFVWFRLVVSNVILRGDVSRLFCFKGTKVGNTAGNSKFKAMKGIIEIEGMEFFAYHGCYETERIVGNKFVVYARMEADCEAAAATDDIGRALNYASAYEVIAREMMVTSHLLEHVCKRIIDALLLAFPQIEHVTVKVSKMNPPLGGKIGATSVTLSK